MEKQSHRNRKLTEEIAADKESQKSAEDMQQELEDVRQKETERDKSLAALKLACVVRIGLIYSRVMYSKTS